MISPIKEKTKEVGRRGFLGCLIGAPAAAVAAPFVPKLDDPPKQRKSPTDFDYPRIKGFVRGSQLLPLEWATVIWQPGQDSWIYTAKPLDFGRAEECKGLWIRWNTKSWTCDFPGGTQYVVPGDRLKINYTLQLGWAHLG